MGDHGESATDGHSGKDRGRHLSSDEDAKEYDASPKQENCQVNHEENAKRQRVLSGGRPPSPGMFFSGIAASPPRFVSLEQIMKAANAVSKMTLAHEIAINKDFKLTPMEPEDSLRKQVKQVVHQAFWDVLKSQLHDDPPCYDHAMILLGEIKEGLLSLLLPHHTKQKQDIDEVLDIEFIRQKTENGALDFQYYAQYILSVMSKLCAPVRDDRIRELMQCDDVISIFKGIFKMLELMRLDMANFHIQLIRPHLQQQSVEYEKQRFAEYLDLNDDGLEFTRRWLKLAADRVPKPATVSSILTNAYMCLFKWNKEEPFPETLLMDQSRFAELCVALEKTTLSAAVMLVTYSTVGASITGLSQFKEDFKNHLNVLLESYNPDNQADIISNVAIQVVTDVNRCLIEHGFPKLTDEMETMLKGQIEETVQPEHRVRSLVRTRILEFTEQCLGSSSAYPIKIPPGLSIMQLELSELTGQFLRLVSHNRAVFGTTYTDILGSEISDQLVGNSNATTGGDKPATASEATD